MHREWVGLVGLVSLDEPVTGPSTRSPGVPDCRCRVARNSTNSPERTSSELIAVARRMPCATIIV
jgi:hypothetical protein